MSADAVSPVRSIERSGTKLLFNIRPQDVRLALSDLRKGFGSLHIWPMLAWQEVRQRYRRSVIGPFWLTISAGIFVGGLGPVYGHLLSQPLADYFPYLATSFIIFQFVAALVNESCTVFIQGEAYIKQMKLPLSIHVLRMAWRNLIVFVHNLTIILVVLILFPPPTLRFVFLAPIGLCLVLLNAVWLGIVLGILSARFRDVPPIIQSIMQLSMFLTPVMWKPEMLGSDSLVVLLNPLYHMIEIIRGPLLGTGPVLESWLAMAIISIVGWTVALMLLSRFRARLPYWV